MALNTYSNISAFVTTIYEDALFVARDTNLLATLVTVFNDRQGLAARTNSEYGTATVRNIGETDDLSSQAFTPAALASLTPGEVGAQFFITDSRVESDPFGVRTDASTELGNSMAQKMETDLLSSFTSLTGGTVGAAGTTIHWGHINAAMTRLRKQNAPMPYVCVLHPNVWHPLGKAASIAGGTQANAPEFQDEVQRRFWVQRTLGVDFYISANVAVDSSDDAVGAMFSRQALALDMRRAPRLEPERDASRRGYELNLSAVYGYGVWRPRFGVQLKFDASDANY